MILVIKMARLTPLSFGMHHCPTEKMKIQNLNMRLKRRTCWILEHKVKVAQEQFL